MKKLLVANRGEVAVRVLRTAAEMGVATVAVFAEDDADATHLRAAGERRPLAGSGPRAYLDIEQLVTAAAGCDAVHPGYGFLSESAAFAAAVAKAGLIFVGPPVAALELLGDKVRARALAAECGVPVLRATAGGIGAVEAAAFLETLPAGRAMVLKAVAGGGGRGMRVVRDAAEVAASLERCRSEAAQAFGDGSLYAEESLPRARHVEVQILGDATGAVMALGERECSIQRRHQKLVEIAPCPTLSAELRRRLAADAARMAEAVGFRNAGTFEFLVADIGAGDGPAHVFIEANPRLQVEHTVTEEVFGIDLVRLQIEIARGADFAALGLDPRRPPAARGHAVQVRVNCETLAADGSARPSTGRLAVFEPPAGPGVRVDTAAAAGGRVTAAYDALLAKVVGHAPSPHFADAVARTRRALAELRVEGVRTNRSLLLALLEHPEFVANRVHTEFLDEHLPALVEAAARLEGPEEAGRRPAGGGARVDPLDPLAVLTYGAAGGGERQAAPAPDWQPARAHESAPEGTIAVAAPMPATVVALEAAEGDRVREGQALLVLSAMKMEHVVTAPASGVVVRLTVAAGDTIVEGEPLAFLEPAEVEGGAEEGGGGEDLDRVRADLAEALGRRAATLDAARPDAVARRRRTGQRTARENVADLCDEGSFVEYGGLAIAAQRQRRTVEDLIARTPADGMVTGIGRVNGSLFAGERARCAVLAYDYTVLAGTQGYLNHRKKDRLFELAERLRLPVVIFTEGGGGRPGDTDSPGVAGLDCLAFKLFAGLSGLVPLVGINSGRCFAGNAALLGCCDVVIATHDSNIGMGGPAMIEGGGLGVYRPEEVGPMAVQVPNGVVDVAVADEAEAVAVAKRYLSYFQGAVGTWDCADQRRLRSIVPENRLRIYEVRRVIETLADSGSVLELRRDFGLGMVTALARIEGRPVGIVANNPRHLAGAIDSPGADKAARFMQLCDAFDLPIVFLCDTPGIMVGPEVERTALVRHCARMFVTGASVSVPFFTVVLRKSYGLGAQAMGGGSHKAPVYTASWPTGEFGGMGLEGAVKLGFRKELAAIEDPEERRTAFERMVARAYEHGKALNSASHFEIDDVIDPADTRRWLANLLGAVPPPAPRREKKRPCVDTW